MLRENCGIERILSVSSLQPSFINMSATISLMFRVKIFVFKGQRNRNVQDEARVGD